MRAANAWALTVKIRIVARLAAALAASFLVVVVAAVFFSFTFEVVVGVIEFIISGCAAFTFGRSELVFFRRFYIIFPIAVLCDWQFDEISCFVCFKRKYKDWFLLCIDYSSDAPLV